MNIISNEQHLKTFLVFKFLLTLLYSSFSLSNEFIIDHFIIINIESTEKTQNREERKTFVTKNKFITKDNVFFLHSIISFFMKQKINEDDMVKYRFHHQHFRFKFHSTILSLLQQKKIEIKMYLFL